MGAGAAHPPLTFFMSPETLHEFLTDSSVNLHESVLHFLGQRAKHIGNPRELNWVFADPVLRFLAPVLFFLHKEKQIILPEDVLALARNRYFENLARWMMGEKQLNKILRALDDAHIDVIPLKGAVLQSILYRDRGLRSMADIDILVRSENFLLAANLLSQAGLQLSQPKNVTLAELEHLPLDILPGELTFHDGQGFLIDLHQSLMPSNWFASVYTVNMQAVWARSLLLSEEQQAAIMAGEDFWKHLLSPYDMLAHLCLHSALHGLQNTKSYLDVDLWVRSIPKEWNWGHFIEIVNQWHVRSAVYHILVICQRMLGTPIPANILAQLDPGWLARKRVGWLISPEIILSGRKSLGVRYPTLVKLALADQLSQIILSLVRVAFPDKPRYSKHHSQSGLLGHWLHIIDVIKRGD